MRARAKVALVVLAVGLIVALLLSTLVLVPPAWADAGHDIAFCFAPFGVFDSLVIVDHAVAANFVAIGWGWYPFPDGTCFAAPPPPPAPPSAVVPATTSTEEPPPGRPNRADVVVWGRFGETGTDVTVVLIQPETGSEIGRFTAVGGTYGGFNFITPALLVGNQDAAWIMAFELLADGTLVRRHFSSEVPCQIHETSDVCGVLLTTPGLVSSLGIVP